jgi:hypothetical protein
MYSEVSPLEELRAIEHHREGVLTIGALNIVTSHGSAFSGNYEKNNNNNNNNINTLLVTRHMSIK